MVKLRSLCLGLIILIIMTACQPQALEVGEIPTLVEFPTETETLIPSETPTITQTYTPSPTDTSTVTPSNTPTPTNTPTATWTRPPSATPTNTLTFTPSPTNTPVATVTPIPTRTPDLPVIETFQSTTANTTNGSPITLRWVVRADSAILDVIDSSGNIIQQNPVELVGTFSTNTPSTGNVVTYRLTAVRGNDEVRSIVTVDMAPDCLTTWFFANPPSDAGCALTPPQNTQIIFQNFQLGFMFRATIGGQSRSCGVQNDRNLYSCYPALVFTGTPPVTPPPNQFAPNDAVAHTFYNNLATGGFWYDVIGFGTDAGSTITVQQQVSTNGRVYFQFPNGIYSFDSSLTSIGASVGRVNP